MHALVVLAHPSGDSFCAGLCREVCCSLADAGHAVDCVDLYREGFTAPMGPGQWQVFIDPMRNRAGSEDMVHRLLQAQIVVTVAPVWLLSMPGALKNWYDRVWLNGVAFLETRNGPRPRLLHVRHFIAISTYGARRWQVVLMGNPLRRWSMTFHRAMCGWRAKLYWWPIFAVYGEERGRREFTQRMKERLLRLR